MAKLEYYSVVVSDKPGRGEHVLSALKEAGVNFVGLWGYPVGKSKSRIDLVPEDAAQLKKAAKKLKIELGKKHTAFHIDRKSTRLNSSHLGISYAVFCL